MSALRKPNWPVNETTLQQGRKFVLQIAKASPIVIACDRDVDGLTSGLLMYRALERLGCAQMHIIPVARGENVHSDSMRQRILALRPAGLIVTDMGSRQEIILADVPTLLIDHHQPRGFPPGAIVVSAHDAAPIPSSSVLAYILAEDVVPIVDLAWLALLGGIADLAANIPYPDFNALKKKYGSKSVTDAIALLNAARRSPVDHVETALGVLMAAQNPREIAVGKLAGAEILTECRAAVSAEFRRFLKIAPKFSASSKAALLRFSSPAQIHPLIATRWAGTLKKYVVIAANDDFIPGRVNFSMRTASGEDLIQFLIDAQPEMVSGEFGFGHKQATGGSLTHEEFVRLLLALGFPAEIADPMDGFANLTHRSPTLF